eukprot:GFUD01027805.1.p1 GENE.GFUD01027805.1~~GFUD01027805.1.p1  ORF type:complete len:593 (+),score=269.16 GFUD01027805.1:403-2181(+)
MQQQKDVVKDVDKEEPSAKPEKKKAVKKLSVGGKTKSVLKEVALAPAKQKDKPRLGQDEETVGAKTEDKKAASTKPEGKKATTPKPDNRKATATDKPEGKKAATKQQNKRTSLVKSEEEKIVGASSVDQEVTAAKPKREKDARDKPEDKEAAGARANEQKTSFTKPEEIKADDDKKPAGKKQTRLSLPEGKKNKKGRVRAATITGQTVSSISTSLNQSTTTTGVSSLGKKNTKGETLLHAACSKGCLATVQTLLSQGATPNTQDHAGWTPLHETASAGRVDLAKLLLEAGARPSVPSQEDRVTALHDAVGSGKMEMVRLLVSMGADKDARDSKGRTPRDMATIMGTDMVDTIENTVVKVQEKDIMETVLQPQEMVLCLSKKVAANNKLVKALVEAAVGLGCKRPSTQIKEDMTHLLVEKGEEQDNMEYYTALVVGAEIVSTSWIEESRKEGKLASCNQFRCDLTEGSWEEGAGISRERRASKQPGLLAGIHFYLTGVFESPSLTRVEVLQIVKMAGGKLITREPDPEFIPPREATVPHHAASSSSLASTSHVILYMAGGRKEPQLKYNMKHVKTLPVSWLLACVTSGRVVEL